MNKKIAFFDIDGVIYDGHIMLEQIKLQEKSGLLVKGTWNKIFIEAVKYKLHLKKYKDAANSLLNIHAMSLKNKDYKNIEDNVYQYIFKHESDFFSYFKKIILLLKETHDICLVTNNFQFTCEAVGKLFKIDKYISSIAEVEDGNFTGRVKLSLVGKKGIISELINCYDPKGSIAVGSSLNDTDMLDKVEFPFVMEPDKQTKKVANEKSWNIVNRNNIVEKILLRIS